MHLRKVRQSAEKTCMDLVHLGRPATVLCAWLAQVRLGVEKTDA